MTGPVLQQINLVVADVEASVAFYRRLGLPVDAVAGAQHVDLGLANGLSIEWDSVDSVPPWDSGWPGASGARGGLVLSFAVAARVDVDTTYQELTAAGHKGHQPPYDAFWGARYAIVDDPDGNSVGLMSPIEESRKFWPPDPLPRDLAGKRGDR